jgi:polyisoprenoid-binding protein YceI
VCAQVFVAHEGTVSFFGMRPFGSIRADNHEVNGFIQAATGNVQFYAHIKSFHFKKTSMEKTFNKKYMESDRYPETDFTGKILNIAIINFNKPGTYPVIVQGNFTLHNVTQWVSHPGTLTVGGDELITNSQFTVKPADFKIKVPTLLGRKMIKEINVSVDMKFALENTH